MSVRLGLASITAARLLGTAVGWAKRSGINLLLRGLVVLVAVSLLDTLFGDKLGLPSPTLSSESWNAVLLLAALTILLWALGARRRLVVEEFSNHSGEGEGLSPTSGLATLLTLELTRLADLHQRTGEPRPVSTQSVSGGRDGKMVLAGISSDADPSFLSNAVSAEAKVSVGPLNIPVGLLLGFLGRLARGPRVVGSLHPDQGTLILTAQVAGAGRPYGWKVTRPAGEAQLPVTDMIEELASRIYTDLAMDRTTKWRATRCFAKGLDAYRDSLRTPLNRRLNLRLAERSFLEASAEDQNFDLAYYNLGVVYRDLGKPEASYSAFQRTIELNPERLEAYYALAVNRWRRRDYDSAVALCDRVLAAEPAPPEAAEAYNLRSLALASQPRRGELGWNTVLASQDRAVANARRALLRSCRSIQDDRERDIERSRVELSTCLVTLAFVCRQAADDRAQERSLARAEALIEQAVILDPSAAQVHFALGDVRSAMGLHQKASVAFRAALQLAPGNLDYRAHLTLALAMAGDGPEARAAAKRALASPYTASEDALDVVAQALAVLGEPSEAERVRSMKVFLRELAAEVKVGDSAGPPADRVASMSTFLSDLAEQMEQLERVGADPGTVAATLGELKRALRGRLATSDWSGRAWEQAQTEIVLGYLATRDQDWFEAERRLEVAIGALEQEHPKEIGERGLRAELARLQLQQGRTADALASAEAAVDLDPLSPKARAALAEVRSSLGEYEVAKEALEIALLRAPEAPEAYVRLGQCILSLARDSRDRTRRDGLLGQAVVHLQQALDLYPSDQLGYTARAQELLGLVHLELHAYEDAIARFEVVRALRPRDALASLEHLGRAYLGNGDYPQAEAACRELIERVGEGELTEVIDRGGEVDVSRGELLGKANLRRAQARVERDVDLHHALEFVRDAKRSVRGARGDGLGPPVVGALADVEAECWACEGLILHKQGKLEEALKRLERAALLGAQPEVYLHLAMVCAEKTELGAGTEAERHLVLARAEAYCRRAAEADTWNRHAQEIRELSSRIEALRRDQPPARERTRFKPEEAERS